jgi:hypothetical protein
MAAKKHKNPGANEARKAPMGAREIFAGVPDTFSCLFVANTA